MQEALDAGTAVLERGGSAMEAVQAAIIPMENSPLFNAGKGAVFTWEGENELDASIMDGRDRSAGAATTAAAPKETPKEQPAPAAAPGSTTADPVNVKRMTRPDNGNKRISKSIGRVRQIGALHVRPARGTSPHEQERNGFLAHLIASKWPRQIDVGLQQSGWEAPVQSPRHGAHE